MSADDGLRQALVSALNDLRIDNSKTDAEIIADIADAVLALPEVAALRAKAAAADRARAEADTWADASREWYYAHRHDGAGTTYATGFEEGWDHADQLIRAALDGPAVQQ